MASTESTSLRWPSAQVLGCPPVPDEQLSSGLCAGPSASLPNWIAVIGNYLPRQFGIATFTTDLCNAIGEEYKKSRIMVLAVNYPGSHYEYPSRVRFELAEGDSSSGAGRRN